MLRLSVFRPLIANSLLKYYSVSVAVAEEAANKPQNHTKEWNNSKPYDSIPGPRPWPIVGNAWRFFGGVDFVKLCKEMHDQYGDIVRLRKLVALGDMTFIFNTKDMEFMCRNEGQWPARESLESNIYYRHVLRKNIFGDTLGLLNGQNEKWGTFRTAVNPILMQPRTTHQYIPQINEIADEFIDYVKILKGRNPNGEMPSNFMDQLNRWSFESITAIALDTRLGVLAENPSEKAEKAMHYILDIFHLSLKLDILVGGKFHRKYNTPTWKRYIECQDYFTDLILELIENAEKKIKNNPNFANKPENDKSVFEKLVAKDTKVAMVMILDMLSAGVDTTAKVSGATLYFLSKSSNAQEKLRLELKRLLPNKNSPLTKEILDDAKYLRACIKESLRIAPITFGHLRIMTKDIVLGGYQIPAGTIVTVPTLYLSNMTDVHYSNPSAYIPERWLRDVKTESVNPFVTLPFGFGARSCIGKRMANMEIEVMVAKMVRNFMLDWQYRDMTFKQDMLYGIGDPLKLRISDAVN